MFCNCVTYLHTHSILAFVHHLIQYYDHAKNLYSSLQNVAPNKHTLQQMSVYGERFRSLNASFLLLPVPSLTPSSYRYILVASALEQFYRHAYKGCALFVRQPLRRA